MQKFNWIIEILDKLVKNGRKGKLIEIRNDGENKIIISIYLENMNPKDYDTYKKKIDLSKFFGKVEHNYSGNGNHTVRIVASLTEQDIVNNPNMVQFF